jgi:L-fucose isomerase-like protein
VPWSADPRVTWTDSRRPAGNGEQYPVLVREYSTLKGALRHEVRRTGEFQPEGWVIQPEVVPLLEDFNIPRAVRQLVSGPKDVGPLSFCYRAPDAQACSWFADRMSAVKEFRDREGIAVQAWAGFGMDAVVWFCGTEGAIMLALDHPAEFQELFETVTETDRARVDLAARHPGVDLVVERGWYSSTNFWSPALFERFVFPHIRTLAAAAHAHGKKFAYVMTTGVEVLGPRLPEAGVDVLYFVDPIDPVQKGLHAGEGPRSPVGLDDARRGDQLDHPEQSELRGDRSRREARTRRPGPYGQVHPAPGGRRVSRHPVGVDGETDRRVEEVALSRGAADRRPRTALDRRFPMPGPDLERVQPKPRLGVLLVTSGWFRDVGLQGTGSDTSREVDRAGTQLVARLEKFADPVYDGILFSTADAERAARRILAAGVDGVLLAPLMWCEDAIPRAALALLKDLPLILWTFSPGPSLPGFVPFQLMIQGSGPVCTMQLSGMLKREGAAFWSVAGHAADDSVLREIESLARAMAVRRTLKDARIGMLPFPCDQMSSTWVDEFGLRARYGIQLRHLELERVRRFAAEAAPEEVAAFRDAVVRSGAQVEVDGRNLGEGIRYALAIQRVMREERLHGLAMNDVIPEMHASFGLRPCLCNHALSSSGAVVSMEADVGAAAGMLAMRLFTGESPFYTEPFSADYAANAVLMGHAGYHDTANANPAAPVQIVRDVEYENSDAFTGAVTFFKYRHGPVTAVNSVWDGGGACAGAASRGNLFPDPPGWTETATWCSARRRPSGISSAGPWRSASASTGCSFRVTGARTSPPCAACWACVS